MGLREFSSAAVGELEGAAVGTGEEACAENSTCVLPNKNKKPQAIDNEQENEQSLNAHLC